MVVLVFRPLPRGGAVRVGYVGPGSGASRALAAAAGFFRCLRRSDHAAFGIETLRRLANPVEIHVGGDLHARIALTDDAFDDIGHGAADAIFGRHLARIDASGICLLHTSDAAAERSRADLGGRRIINKKTHPAPPPRHYMKA